jgi:hypothetical protein
MIEFLDFLLDILVLGDSFTSLRRISDGDDAERESRLYAAPEMRRLRWIARMVVLAYLVTVITLPFLLAAYTSTDTWLLWHPRIALYAGQYFVVAILLYIAAAWAGFVLLRRVFRRKRREIAERLALEWAS